jgi:N-methylhydantoinase A/oxoprolinase/acetone carboxylase beta subunit
LGIANNNNALVLGIDTGGTYTDGVLLEYHSRRVLAAHKSLTTKHDYAIGIEQVIDNIVIDDPSRIQLVSISTTLATNAIAEGKGKRVALFLIGYDPELIASFRMENRFATPYYAYFKGGHDLFGNEKEPLDLGAILNKVAQIKDQVDAIAISSYFSPLNPEHEIQAHQALRETCDLPVVLGHQLSTKLGSIERATTAALNASLLAILQEFIQAVRRALKQRSIDAPLMVVRGDGTLMSADFASSSPVETIHSGPAASAIGGRFISEINDALVIDIGGTTTDIALIKNGQVTINEDGASVAGYKTAVKAADLLSFGLGGDSHITLSRDNGLRVGPERVVPLSFLAYRFPDVLQQLNHLRSRNRMLTAQDWLEYWFLQREPKPEMLEKSSRLKALVELLRTGPKSITEITKRLDLLHISQVGANELIRQEIIAKAGLTPTDLLHIQGEFTNWHVEAASTCWDLFCRSINKDPLEMRSQVWSIMTAKIVAAIISFLTRKTLPDVDHPDPGIATWFFLNSLDNSHPQLETSFRLRLPIIGIGAPAAYFLQPVADVLHTTLVLPPHYPVANAVGAVAGSVMVTEEILIYPRLSTDGFEVIGYYVQDSSQRALYADLEQALQHARTLGPERALQNAILAGADNPQLTIAERSDGLDTYRIQAQAAGNPRLMKSR